MNRKTAPYGTYRNFPKIDLYRAVPNAPMVYVGSTTWARTCNEARLEYAKKHALNHLDIVARFNRD